MDVPITPTCAFFCVGSPEGSPPFLCGEDFLGFFPEPFPGAITPAALTTATPATATAIIITAAIIATAIGGTLTRVKVFPFGEIFQKVSSSTSL